MDKDDKKPAAAAPAPAPVKASAPAEEKKPEPAAAPAELSAPTLTEGRVDELDHKRDGAGQLSPEDGAAPADEVTDALKAKFSGEGGGTF